MKEAKARVKKLGIDASHGDPRCDKTEGSSKSPLPVFGGGVYAVAAYYATQSEAELVAQRYGDPLWWGEVRTYCHE